MHFLIWIIIIVVSLTLFTTDNSRLWWDVIFYWETKQHHDADDDVDDNVCEHKMKTDTNFQFLWNLFPLNTLQHNTTHDLIVNDFLLRSIYFFRFVNVADRYEDDYE